MSCLCSMETGLSIGKTQMQGVTWMVGGFDNLKSPSLISGTWAGLMERLASVGPSIGASGNGFSMTLGFLLAWRLASKREQLESKHCKRTTWKLHGLFRPDSEVRQCHSCHILLVTIEIQAIPDSRGGELGCTSWWSGGRVTLQKFFLYFGPLCA